MFVSVWVFFIVLVVFGIPVAFMKATWLQTIGLANHWFRITPKHALEGVVVDVVV